MTSWLAREGATTTDSGRGASEANPRVGPVLRLVSVVHVLILATSGIGLLFLPGTFRPIWPWDISPFNAALVGGVYLASVPAVTVVALGGRWSPSRVVVPMLLAFASIGLAASVVYAAQFHFERWTTWVWYGIFIILPLNAAAHLWAYRQWGPANARGRHWTWQLLLAALAAGLGLYGLSLLIVPGLASAFWPWPVDAFHGRLYGGAFVAGAVGAALTARAASPLELRLVALTMLLLGGLALAGTVLVDAGMQRVAWTEPATWLWIGGFGGLAATGAVLLAYSYVPRLARTAGA